MFIVSVLHIYLLRGQRPAEIWPPLALMLLQGQSSFLFRSGSSGEAPGRWSLMLLQTSEFGLMEMDEWILSGVNKSLTLHSATGPFLALSSPF